MGRRKRRAELISYNRRYNVYLGLLHVAEKLECDVADVRAALIQKTGVAYAWISNIERAGLTEAKVNISIELARKIEAFFSKELGYHWQIEIRPSAAVKQTSLALAQ